MNKCRTSLLCQQSYSMLWFFFFFFYKTFLFEHIFNVNGFRMQKLYSSFFPLGFLLQKLMIHSIAEEGREPPLFSSNISISSRMFKQTFVVLHLRWLPSIINPGKCNYSSLLRNEIYHVVNLNSHKLSPYNYKRND